MVLFLILLGLIAATTALPAQDPVLMKLDQSSPGFGYAEADDGTHHMVDSLVTLEELDRDARYYPLTDNRYHLFTRSNPSISQPLVMSNFVLLAQSNFDVSKPIVVLIHGFLGSGTTGFNREMVPAVLAGEDVNVIVVDWSAGSHIPNKGMESGFAIGRFFYWLNLATGASMSQYHIIGFGEGAHAAGNTARTMRTFMGHWPGEDKVARITGLDPSSLFVRDYELKPDYAAYVEVIHTSAGVLGWARPLGHVDFYPNGGRAMPGCDFNPVCDHQRSYQYMAESVRTGRFTGTECGSYRDARFRNCTLSGRLNMGGLKSKTGSGVFYLETNQRPPFSLIKSHL